MEIMRLREMMLAQVKIDSLSKLVLLTRGRPIGEPYKTLAST